MINLRPNVDYVGSSHVGATRFIETSNQYCRLDIPIALIYRGTYLSLYDAPYAPPQTEIHYFSIMNSLLITLFLTGVVAMILLRTLRKDISTYNEVSIGCVAVSTALFLS